MNLFYKKNTLKKGVNVEVTKVIHEKCNNLVIEKDIQTELTDDCKLKIKACFNIERPFKVAKVCSFIKH